MRAHLSTLGAFLAFAACSSQPPLPPQPSPPPATVIASATPAPSASAAPPPGPPAAQVREVRDTYFGKEIVDPYRWMETESPDYASFMKQQSEHTRNAIDALSARAELRARVKELNNGGARVGSVERWNKKIFSLEAEPGHDNFKLYVRDGLAGKKRLLIDPQALGKDGSHYSIDYFVPSDNARYVVYGLSKSGSEMSVLHVLETDTGKDLADVIDRTRYPGVSWLDDRSFFYKRNRKLPDDAPATERFTKSSVYLHVLGNDPEKDEQVFGYGVSPDVTMTEEAFPSVYSPPNSPYLFGMLYHGVQKEQSVFFAPKKARKGAKTPWKKLFEPKDEVTSIDPIGEDLYVMTHHGAPRSKILRMSLKKPDLASAKVVVPEGEAVITSMGTAKDGLYVRKLDGGFGRLFRVSYKDNQSELIDPGAHGSIQGFFTEPTTPGTLFRLDSWTAPPRYFSFEPEKKKAEQTDLIPPWSVVFKDIVATEVKAKSADGTMIPLSVIHRRDLPRDGKNPTYLNGYGSYGSSWDPAFEPMNLAWLERGGIMAVCHVRGGGEYGVEWHKAGKLGTKTNTIDDFIACGQWLIDEKLTSPAHLAGQGTSAGGIMIGGAIVRRPDLFGAAVIRVGMVNALRFEQIPIGPFNTAEFGTVATKEGFEMLLAIDAYHKVEKGKPYPAVLLTTGITDPRVSPWQMAKMAARLKAATSSGKPVLLRVDYGSGHGVGSTKTQREEELADTFAFLNWQIGKK